MSARRSGNDAGAGQVDNYVGDRDVELATSALDHPGLEPVRALSWVCRDHDFVGGELAELVLDRDERPVGAYLAGDLEALGPRPADAGVEAPTSQAELRVDVRHRVLDAGDENWGNHTQLGPRHSANEVLAQLLARKRLVCHDEQPVA